MYGSHERYIWALTDTGVSEIRGTLSGVLIVRGYLRGPLRKPPYKGTNGHYVRGYLERNYQLDKPLGLALRPETPTP